MIKKKNPQQERSYCPTNQPTNQPTNGPSLIEAYRKLSVSECKVLAKFGQGNTNRQIAAELFITESTVENHITRIGKKLGLSGRGMLKRWAKIRYKNL